MQALPDAGWNSSVQAAVLGHLLGSLINQVHRPPTETTVMFPMAHPEGTKTQRVPDVLPGAFTRFLELLTALHSTVVVSCPRFICEERGCPKEYTQQGGEAAGVRIRTWGSPTPKAILSRSDARLS